MTETVLIALVLGLAAGLAPGPYTTMVAATGLERGFRAAAPLALAPLVTDLLPLLLTVYLLTSLRPEVLTLLGYVGGIVVALIGIRLLTRYGVRSGAKAVEEHATSSSLPTIRFWHVVTGTVLSPSPWFFWLAVGSPLLIRRWENDWRLGVTFLVIIFGSNIGSASALAWTASRGRRVLAPFWRHRILRLMGVGLILAGILLVWQAATGERMQIDVDTVENLFSEDTLAR